jgi:hypothetical protein
LASSLQCERKISEGKKRERYIEKPRTSGKKNKGRKKDLKGKEERQNGAQKQ